MHADSGVGPSVRAHPGAPKSETAVAEPHRGAPARASRVTFAGQIAGIFLAVSTRTMGRMRGLPLAALLVGLTCSRSAATPGELLWSETRVPGWGNQVAIGAGSLVVFSRAHSDPPRDTIRVYDPATGTPRRDFSRHSAWVTDMLVRGGLIILAEEVRVAGTIDQYRSDLVALDLRSGHERWRVPLSGRATLVAAGARIFAAADDGVITSHALRSGRVLWRNADGPVTRFVVRYGRIAAVGTRRPAGSPTRLVLRVLDKRTGAEIWKDDDDFGSLGAEGTSVAWAGSRILVGGLAIHDVYFDPYDDPLLVAYDANSGARLWTDLPYGADDMVVDGIATHANQAFVVVRRTVSYRAYAYDTRSGELLWPMDPEWLFTDGRLSGPLFAGGTILFAADPYSHPSEFLAAALDASDGTMAWRADADAGGTFSYASAMATDGMRVYVVGMAPCPDAPEQCLGVWVYSLR